MAIPWLLTADLREINFGAAMKNFDQLKIELERYYAGTSVLQCDHAIDMEHPFNPLKSLMDDYACRHRECDAMRLKAAQYEIIAENFIPVIFRNTPFWSETGLKIAEYDGHSSLSSGGWLLCRNFHLYADIDRKAFEQHYAADRHCLHLSYGPYCDYDHHCFPFTRVIENGLCGIYEDIIAAQKKNTDEKKAVFYDTAIRGIMAVKKMGEKFAAAALAMLTTITDAEERAHLELIAATAGHIPWQKAETFYEGLACLWFLHEIGGVMDGIGMSVVGHPDRMLIRLYENDIAAGRLSKEEAYDLICRFLMHTDCKLKLNIPVNEQFNGGEQGDTLILGGTDKNGKEIFNDLTMLFLQAHHELKLIYPKIHCRVSRKSSERYLQEIARDFLAGRNVISFLNDDILIPAQEKAGKRHDDAVNYVAGGCWEVILEGSEHSEGANCYFSLGKIVDLSIHLKPQQEEELGMTFTQLDAGVDFETVYAIMLGNVETALRKMCTAIAQNGKIWPDVNPCPFFSSGLKGCVETGTDYTAGGAAYSPHALPFTGVAIMVDSLLSIKSLCFEQKKCTLPELLAAVRNNWENAEDLRLAALACEHFGDNHGNAAQLAARLLNDIARITKQFKNERGGPFLPGIYSYVDIVQWADKTLATPDGRRKGDFLTQGLTPSRFHSQEGITALLNDIQTLPLLEFPQNSVITVSIPRNGLKKEVFAALIRSFCKTGPGILQLNCVNREELDDAIKNPQNHQDLIVRLYGYSAKFVTLDSLRQQEFISRGIF